MLGWAGPRAAAGLAAVGARRRDERILEPDQARVGAAGVASGVGDLVGELLLQGECLLLLVLGLLLLGLEAVCLGLQRVRLLLQRRALASQRVRLLLQRSALGAERVRLLLQRSAL